MSDYQAGCNGELPVQRLRNYKFTSSLESHEDELPDDMTNADYDEWFDLSYVDGVRLGPRPERIE